MIIYINSYSIKIKSFIQTYHAPCTPCALWLHQFLTNRNMTNASKTATAPPKIIATMYPALQNGSIWYPNESDSARENEVSNNEKRVSFFNRNLVVWNRYICNSNCRILSSRAAKNPSRSVITMLRAAIVTSCWAIIAWRVFTLCSKRSWSVFIFSRVFTY
jgi:hypothetical protein